MIIAITQILQFLCELFHQHQQPWRSTFRAVRAWTENYTCCIWAASPSRGGSLATCSIIFIKTHNLLAHFHAIIMSSKSKCKEWDEAEGKAKTWSAVRAVLAPALALTYKHAIKGTKESHFSCKQNLNNSLAKLSKALPVYKQAKVKSQLLYIYSVYSNIWTSHWTNIQS